ncbi:hypothetical protein EGT74_07225 [Chitinophaga lutea]|uniref:Uncharacterized protein n=1 Tax=Chitinophaga lutea TaxID=2488634 RepID=A0A3N4QNP9_9BACT|nr:hypothetical protein EGT74_07225 [Chitinophaga lutea]
MNPDKFNRLKPAILLRSFAHPPVILLSNTFKSARVANSTGESQEDHRTTTGGSQKDDRRMRHLSADKLGPGWEARLS